MFNIEYAIIICRSGVPINVLKIENDIDVAIRFLIIELQKTESDQFILPTNQIVHLTQENFKKLYEQDKSTYVFKPKFMTNGEQSVLGYIIPID